MSTPGWRTSNTVEGFDLQLGHEVPVTVGLIDTAAGGVQLALQVGEGHLVILALQAGNQLIEHVAAVMTERLVITAERLGSDQP